MGYRDLNVKPFRKVAGKMLGAIDGAMLSAGAAEADLHVSEFPLHEALDMLVDHGVNIVEEFGDSPVVLKELDHLRIQSRELAVMLVLARVIDGPAIKHIASTIA